MDGVTFASLDGTNERAGQHNLACFERQSIRSNLLRAPSHCNCRMIEHARG